MNTTRRRAVIESSSESDSDDAVQDSFLSDDESAGSQEYSYSEAMNRSREERERRKKNERESEGEEEDEGDSNSASLTDSRSASDHTGSPAHNSTASSVFDSHHSFASSTPHKGGERDRDLSDDLNDSMSHMSVNEHCPSAHDRSPHADRSRSFLEEKEAMSPISQRHAAKAATGDEKSKRTLRERLMRNTVNKKKSREEQTRDERRLAEKEKEKKGGWGADSPSGGWSSDKSSKSSPASSLHSTPLDRKDRVSQLGREDSPHALLTATLSPIYKDRKQKARLNAVADSFFGESQGGVEGDVVEDSRSGGEEGGEGKRVLSPEQLDALEALARPVSTASSDPADVSFADASMRSEKETASMRSVKEGEEGDVSLRSEATPPVNSEHSDGEEEEERAPIGKIRTRLNFDSDDEEEVDVKPVVKMEKSTPAKAVEKKREEEKEEKSTKEKFFTPRRSTVARHFEASDDEPEIVELSDDDAASTGQTRDDTEVYTIDSSDEGRGERKSTPASAHDDSIVLLDSDEEETKDAKPVIEKKQEAQEVVTEEENELDTGEEIAETLEELNEKLTKSIKLLKTLGARMPDGGERMKKDIADKERKIAILKYRIKNPVKKEEGHNVPDQQDQMIDEEKEDKEKKPYVLDSSIEIMEDENEDVQVEAMSARRDRPDPTLLPKYNTNDYLKNLEFESKMFRGKMTDEKHYMMRTVTGEVIHRMHKQLNSIPEPTETTETPKGLKIDLMPHQKSGLTWLMWREAQEPSGGILGDDMGLGKTLSMISLVLEQKNRREKRMEEDEEEYDRERRERRKAAAGRGLVASHATLVVAPASLVYQWESEINNRVKADRLSVHVFHGPKNKRESNAKRLARYDVVITTYSILSSELTEKVHFGAGGSDSEDSSDEEDSRLGGKAAVKKAGSKNKIAKNTISVLTNVAWERIILDEAHQIKNKASMCSKAACRLVGERRWCLSGTPIHNNLWDLYSLFRFMRVRPFDEEKIWKDYISTMSKTSSERLNTMMKALLLRRTKTQECAVTKKTLVNLPQRHFQQHNLLLEGHEKKIYEMMFAASQSKVKEMLKAQQDQADIDLYGRVRRRKGDAAGGGGEVVNPFLTGPRTLNPNDKFQSMTCMLVMLLRLRQACVHLALTKQAVDIDAFASIGAADEADVLQSDLANMSLVDPDEAEDKEGDFDASPLFEETSPSCKTTKIMEIVDDILEKKDKVVIVSQWTSYLDILRRHLENRRVNFTAINGQVPTAARQPLVDSFNQVGAGYQVMLLSLTAGGCGLNLIGGNHLILCDLHWNPSLEAQACDRIYRMGQKKEVYIHKIVCERTMEQRVLQLQQTKLDLSKGVLEGAAKKMNKLSVNDLKFLFELDNKKAGGKDDKPMATVDPNAAPKPAGVVASSLLPQQYGYQRAPLGGLQMGGGHGQGGYDPRADAAAPGFGFGSQPGPSTGAHRVPPPARRY